MNNRHQNWKFPLKIDFETAAHYISKFDETDSSSSFCFDLRKTKFINSTFIGFLIHAKTKIEKEGGLLQIISSSELNRIFRETALDKFLSSY